MSDNVSVLALCNLQVDGRRCDWGVLARQMQRSSDVSTLVSGEIYEAGTSANRTRSVISAADSKEWSRAEDFAKAQLDAASKASAGLTTVLDPDYPSNLRLVHNLPPFLFYRGQLDHHRDAYSMAVVGTRTASDAGLRKAERMARELASLEITVTSGLARGIDTAAHSAALDRKGRTIAVFGTGILKVYPKENARLAERIVSEGGLVVSQFFPTAPTRQWMFPKRNEVTSGISQGTVVIEASETSGARLQARIAHRHGKEVFLISSLTKSQPWATEMIKQRQATEVEAVDDVVRYVAQPERIQALAAQSREQLAALW